MQLTSAYLNFYNTSTQLTLQHGTVSSVGDGEYVRRYFVPFDAFIPFHDFFRING